MGDEYTESYGFFQFAEGAETSVSFDLYGGGTVDEVVKNFKRFLTACQFAPEYIDRIVLLNS